MKAIIKLDVPEWQIGKDVTVHFPDTMVKHEKCEPMKEQETIVRCKDCKRYIEQAHECDALNHGCIKPDFFCGYGIRKDGDGE